MEHNLIIETWQHILPTAGSPSLLVTDKDFSNSWIMLGWQMCCTRPNMMAEAGLSSVDPMALHSLPTTYRPPWLPAMSNHSASDGRGNSWEAGLWEGGRRYSSPTLSWKALVSLSPPYPTFRSASLCNPLSLHHPISPHPKFLLSPTPTQSHQSQAFKEWSWHQGTNRHAPPWAKYECWRDAPSIFFRLSRVWQGVHKPFNTALNNFVSQHIQVHGSLN